MTQELTKQLKQLMQLIPGGVFCYDVDYNQEFMFISDSTPKMFGYTMEQFLTKFNNRFPDMVYEEDRDRILKEIDSQIHNGDIDYCEYRIEMADGTLKWVYDRGRVIVDETGKRWFYVVIMDADELKAAENRRREHDAQLLDELRIRSGRDIMTGLLNHHAAVAYIEKAIKKYNGGVLFYLDLDNFKRVNNTKGYLFGDQLLKETANCLGSLVKPEEILARFGGDEFIIFIPGSYNSSRAQKRAEQIIENIQEVVSYDIKDGGCSIGIIISTNGKITFNEMFQQAANVMHQVKTTKKGTYNIKVIK